MANPCTAPAVQTPPVHGVEVGRRDGGARPARLDTEMMWTNAAALGQTAAAGLFQVPATPLDDDVSLPLVSADYTTGKLTGLLRAGFAVSVCVSVLAAEASLY